MSFLVLYIFSKSSGKLEALMKQLPVTWSNVTARLTHWGQATHICVSKLTIIVSDNGLSPGRRQAIIWSNAGLLLTGPLGTNFSEILIEIQENAFENVCERASIQSRPQWVKRGKYVSPVRAVNISYEFKFERHYFVKFEQKGFASSNRSLEKKTIYNFKSLITIKQDLNG